ncbi:MAG: DUF262 domain-containing protein [Pirellulaceae bacterium]
MPAEPQLSHDVLYQAVERERKRASVRALDLSFNELADMYCEGELEIRPEYQRTFRWSEEKSSRFIESIVLEMPIPPIYTIEVREGHWELIDGLQRLSTFLYLRGQLDLPDRDPPIVKGETFLRLQGCDIVPELNNFLFDELPTTLQYRIRRASLRVEVVRRESNPRFAYHMFKRLNTGGELLSAQEERNCSIRLLGTQFNDFIFLLSKDENFQACIEDITDEYRKRMGEQELVLRFLAFKNCLNEFVHNIDPFLSEFMERVTDSGAENHLPFDYQTEELEFRKTFRIIANTMRTRAFCRWANNRYSGGFSMGHFEAFSIGVSRVVNLIPDPLTQEKQQEIEAAMDCVKKDGELRKLTVGGGKNFRNIYEQKIELVAKAIRDVL